MVTGARTTGTRSHPVQGPPHVRVLAVLKTAKTSDRLRGFESHALRFVVLGPVQKVPDSAPPHSTGGAVDLVLLKDGEPAFSRGDVVRPVVTRRPQRSGSLEVDAALDIAGLDDMAADGARDRVDDVGLRGYPGP